MLRQIGAEQRRRGREIEHPHAVLGAAQERRELVPAGLAGDVEADVVEPAEEALEVRRLDVLGGQMLRSAASTIST